MEQTLIGLIGVILGAILSGVFLESYKRHHDRQGTASAIAGEIHSILHFTQRQHHVDHLDWFRNALVRLENGEQVNIPEIFAPPVQIDPVFAEYLDEIGSLRGTLPERITTFYTNLMSIRHDIRNLVDGKLDGDLAFKAAMIREDLALWEETCRAGLALRDDLRAIAAASWPSWNKPLR